MSSSPDALAQAPIEKRPRPNSLSDLFFSFTILALQGFGGVLAVVQRELVEKKRWMTREEFVEEWAVAQIMPGPNVVNLSLMIGDRYFGLRGAMTALAGMLAVPLLVVLSLALVYARFADNPQVAGALRGMGAVAAGLITATGLKLSSAIKKNPLGVPVCIVFGIAIVRGHRAAALAVGVCAARPGRPGLRHDLPQDGEGRGMTITMTGADWLSLFVHYLSLSLLSVGGAITTAPDMHRYLVDQQGWLTDPQFSASIAIAQAAPGPNVLFVALLGWNVGLNAGGLPTALLGLAVTMVGIMIPSTTLTYLAARWGHQNRELRAVRAFKQGMAPIVIALLVATGWILATGSKYSVSDWPIWAVAVVTAIVVWRTKVHLLWLLGAGAVLGWMGWV